MDRDSSSSALLRSHRLGYLQRRVDLGVFLASASISHCQLFDRLGYLSRSPADSSDVLHKVLKAGFDRLLTVNVAIGVG